MTVQSFVGMPESSLTSWAKENGINVSRSEDYSDEVNEGRIISQSLTSGEISKDTTISYVVSLGKDPDQDKPSDNDNNSDSNNSGGNNNNNTDDKENGDDSGSSSTDGQMCIRDSCSVFRSEMDGGEVDGRLPGGDGGEDACQYDGRASNLYPV